ncbi:exonuclease mut-7 homolog isoform X4 [Rhipicephalus microplus]|uniref:exonuclease mut-7 homolog isoform X4 n=1 Tax=Rhipicephalus microplus TaxID=6941 RepID=UPI003F6B430A
MDPMRPEHLESLWHSARNRKTGALLKVLQTYFDKAQNCFECAFLLMCATSDFYESRPNSLAVTIMNVFQEWLSEHKEVYAAFLTDDIKRMALLAVLKQTKPFLIALVCDVYKLEENGVEYMDIVQNLLLRKRFSEASTVVASLKLHGNFTLEDIPIPLFLMDKMALLESYLEGQPKLQKELLIFLDNLYHDGNLADGVISNLNGKMISRDRNHPKTLEKIISRLLKQYGLPGETCPHVHYKRSKNALRYLFFKKYIEDDYSEPGWREMVCEVVGTNSSLQRDLLNELLWVNDYESALNFAVKLCVPDRQWPRAIRSFMGQCGPEKVQELIESWNSYRDQDDPSKYLPFRLELCDVEMVDTADGFENCIEIIKNYNLVGIDAEWKPTMGLTPARLSLVQLAVWDNVFVLDMLKLSEILSEEQWGQLYTDVLGSNEILKLGFGIAEDLKLLAETIKFPGGKVQNIVDLCSFAEKLPELETPLPPCAQQCLFEEGDEMTCVDERPFVRSDQPLATCEFRVIVDTMVLGLGRYLRLCGIDTVILRHGDERDQAVKLAQKESRVIITCGAPYRQMKQYVARNQCFCVNNMVPAREQMKDVLKFYNVAVKEKDILTRCTECNASHFTLVPSEHMWQLQASLRGEGLAVAGGKALVRSYGPDCSIDFISCRFDNGVLVKCKDLVFEHLSHVSMFYVCVGCGKVYWDGSHHGRFKEQSWLKELIFDEPLPVPESCAD